VLWVSRRMYLSLPEPCRPSSTFAQAQIRSPPCSLGEKLTGSPASLRIDGRTSADLWAYIKLRCMFMATPEHHNVNTVMSMSNDDSGRNCCRIVDACCRTRPHHQRSQQISIIASLYHEHHIGFIRWYVGSIDANRLCRMLQDNRTTDMSSPPSILLVRPDCILMIHIVEYCNHISI
jgi:hypothetical protein